MGRCIDVHESSIGRLFNMFGIRFYAVTEVDFAAML